MNKKGFTLVELLAVIIILAILIILVYPMVMNVLNRSRTQVTTITRDNVIKAAELFANEVYLCRAGNVSAELYGIFGMITQAQKNSFTCVTAAERLTRNEGFQVSLDDLHRNGYLSRHNCRFTTSGQGVVVRIRASNGNPAPRSSWDGTEIFDVQVGNSFTCN